MNRLLLFNQGSEASTRPIVVATLAAGATHHCEMSRVQLAEKLNLEICLANVLRAFNHKTQPGRHFARAEQCFTCKQAQGHEAHEGHVLRSGIKAIGLVAV